MGRSLMDFEEPEVNLLKGMEGLNGELEKRGSSPVLVKVLVTLSPVMMWGKGSIPSEVNNPAKETSVQSIESLSWLHLPIIKCERKTRH